MFEQPHKFADIICHIVLPFLCVLNLLSFIHQYCKCTHPPIIWYQHHTFLLKDFLFSHGWIPFGEPISVFPFFASPNSDSPNVASADPPSHLIPPSHFFVQNLCADVRINSSWILLPSLRRQSPIPYPSPDIAVMPSTSSHSADFPFSLQSIQFFRLCELIPVKSPTNSNCWKSID